MISGVSAAVDRGRAPRLRLSVSVGDADAEDGFVALGLFLLEHRLMAGEQFYWDRLALLEQLGVEDQPRLIA